MIFSLPEVDSDGCYCNQVDEAGYTFEDEYAECNVCRDRGYQLCSHCGEEVDCKNEHVEFSDDEDGGGHYICLHWSKDPK